MVLASIRTDGDSLEIIDQLALPHTERWIPIRSPDEAYDAIKAMQIRGAPAIASLASLSISSYLSNVWKETPDAPYFQTVNELAMHLLPILDKLVKARPTAVNLSTAISRLKVVLGAAQESDAPVNSAVEALIKEGRAVANEDVERNRTMGRLGAEWVLRNAEEKGVDTSNGINILTVCNTGSLATSVRFGT